MQRVNNAKFRKGGCCMKEKLLQLTGCLRTMVKVQNELIEFSKKEKENNHFAEEDKRSIIEGTYHLINAIKTIKNVVDNAVKKGGNV